MEIEEYTKSAYLKIIKKRIAGIDLSYSGIEISNKVTAPHANKTAIWQWWWKQARTNAGHPIDDNGRSVLIAVDKEVFDPEYVSLPLRFCPFHGNIVFTTARGPVASGSMIKSLLCC